MTEDNNERPNFPLTILENDGTSKVMSPEEALEFWDTVQRVTDSLTFRDDGDKGWKWAKDFLNETVPGLVLDGLGGYVPIQGHGTYKGEQCYFRARYETASFSVGPHDEHQVTSYNAKWYAEAVVTDDAFGAGYLTPGEVVVILRDVLIPNLKMKTKEEGEAEMSNFAQRVDEIVAEMKKNEPEN